MRPLATRKHKPHHWGVEMVGKKKWSLRSIAIYGLVPGVLSALVGYSWIQSAWPELRKELIKQELEGIRYLVELYSAREFPETLDFIKGKDYKAELKWRLREYRYTSRPVRWLVRNTILRKDRHLLDLSRVEYVWPGSGYITSGYHFLPSQPLINLYGEFDWYYEGDVVGPTIEGLPDNEVILLVYSEEGPGDETYLCPLAGIDYFRIVSHDEAEERISLQKAFLRLSVNESDINYLLKGLGHPNSGFRFRSAEALAKLGQPKGKEFLERNFLENDIFLKIRAADALARIGDDKAIEFLQEIAGQSDNKYVRCFAERTLRETEEWRTTPDQCFPDDEWERLWKDWKGTPLP